MSVAVPPQASEQTSILDHASIPVGDLARAAAFYEEVLATLGMRRLRDRPDAVGFGPPTRRAPVFWLLPRRDGTAAAPGIGLHLSFQAASRAAVDAFYAAALRCGAVAAGAPGIRTEYTAPFYGAFVLDLDGFKIEAVCRSEG